MAKRIAVKYVGSIHSRCSRMREIPEGTEFKGVIGEFSTDTEMWVNIRGSSLRKACKNKHEFSCKVYMFLIKAGGKHNAMEVV